MSTKTYEPKYQCWVEKDFLADRAVMRMTPTQRHFYRALLQAAFNVDTRPYLPADDQQLWQIADADDLGQWQSNKGPVLAKFQPTTAEDGTELLAHKRILSDWDQVLDYVDKKRTAGVARQQRSARAEQPAAPAPKPKVLKETETERETQTVSETEPVPVSGSVTGSQSSPTGSASSGTGGSGGTATVLVQEPVAAICEAWSSLYSKPAEAADVAAIIQSFYNEDAAAARAEIPALLGWAANVSNHWGPAKNHLQSTADLSRSFAEVHRQWSLYTEKARAGVAEKQAQRSIREAAERPVRNAVPETVATSEPEPAREEDGDLEFGTVDISEDELDD